MPPKSSRAPTGAMPTSQEELDQLIADRVATAMARFEAARVDLSGGSGGSGDQGDGPRSSTGEGNLVFMRLSLSFVLFYSVVNLLCLNQALVTLSLVVPLKCSLIASRSTLMALKDQSDF